MSFKVKLERNNNKWSVSTTMNVQNKWRLEDVEIEIRNNLLEVETNIIHLSLILPFLLDLK